VHANAIEHVKRGYAANERAASGPTDEITGPGGKLPVADEGH
jgi:hypothetical protein